MHLIQCPRLRLTRQTDHHSSVVWPPIIPMESENIIIWNVRGLNARSHRDAVCELVRAERPSIVYLQETKLSVISDYDLI
jgi:hypothetical protein